MNRLTDDQRRLVTDYLEQFSVLGIAGRFFPALLFCAIRKGIDEEDIEAEAHYRLVLAAQTFDASRGVPFGRYAKWRIKGAIQVVLMRRANSAKKGSRAVVSGFTKLRPTNDRHGYRLTIFDAIIDKRSPDPEVAMSAADSQRVICEQVRSSLCLLTTRRREAVMAYFGIDQEAVNFRQYGERIGVSFQSVYFQVQRGLKDLKQQLRPVYQQECLA